MKTTWNLCIVVFVVLLSAACKSSTKNTLDLEAEKKKIQELLNQQNQFLLTQDISIFRQMVACNDSSIGIGSGSINYHNYKNKTDEQIIKDFGFAVMKYTKIDEMIEPIIRFSPDLRIAYIVGQTKLQYEATDSLGNKKNGEFTDAWLTVWENNNGCWSEKAMAETFQ